MVLLGLGTFGCLPDAKPVQGRKLASGRDISNPEFGLVDGKPSIFFQRKRTNAMPGRGGAFDLFAVSTESGEPRLLLANISDTRGWSNRDSQSRYYMVDESRPADGAPVSQGTLVRIRPGVDELDRIAEVTSYSLPAEGPILYQRYVPGSPLRQLHLRLSPNVDYVLGAVAGQIQVISEKLVYFIEGQDRALVRWTGPDSPPERLRAQVSRFSFRPDMKLAVMVVADQGRPQTVVFDVTAKTARPLPVANPCCWLGWNGAIFIFGENANVSMNTAAKLHYFNTDTNEDRVVIMPVGMADVVGQPVAHPHRPGQRIYADSQRRLAIETPGDDPPFRVAEIRPAAQQFTSDGRFMLYLDPIEGTMQVSGRLMVIDADLRGPPRLLSPVGAEVSLSPQLGYFWVGGPEPVVFWSHYGPGPSDLFFANHETGAVRRVAESISEVSVTQDQIFGIVRVSLQDLTGDLVRRNALTGSEILFEHEVSDFTLGPNGSLAFLVSERQPSDRNGLWLTSLEKADGQRIKKDEP